MRGMDAAHFTVPHDAVLRLVTEFTWTIRDLMLLDCHLLGAKRDYVFERDDWSKNGALDQLTQWMSREPEQEESEGTADRIYRANHDGRSRAEVERDVAEQARLEPYIDVWHELESDRDATRKKVSSLAQRVIEAAVAYGVPDTSALSLFRQTWDDDDVAQALALLENLAARIRVRIKFDDASVAARWCTGCLSWFVDIEHARDELATRPPLPPFQPEYDEETGRLTPEHHQRLASFQDCLDERDAEMVERQDELKSEIQEFSEMLMAVASRPDVNADPSPLHGMLHQWSSAAEVDLQMLDAARDFLNALTTKPTRAGADTLQAIGSGISVEVRSDSDPAEAAAHGEQRPTKKCWTLAHQSYERAVLAENAPLATDLRAVWEWLRERDPDDYRLPKFKTWCRYVRGYDAVLCGVTKNTSKFGRAGRSIIPRDRL